MAFAEKRWTRTDPIKVADEENVPCCNPVLFKDNNGKLYLFYKVGENTLVWRTMVITSVDKGSVIIETVKNFV